MNISIIRHSTSYLLLQTVFLSCFCMLNGCSEQEFDNEDSYEDSYEDSSYISAPTGLWTSVSGYSITLHWNSVSNASQYKVYYSESSSSGPWTLVDSTTGTSSELMAYSAGTYYFVVTAVNNANEESSYSSYAYCIIQSSGGGSGGGNGGNGGTSTTTVPSAPSGLTGSRQGPAMYPYVYLSWDYTSGADSYIIYRSTSANGTYSQIGTSYSCSYSDDSPKSGNNYYKVAAKNSAGIGPKSNYCVVSITNDSYKPDFSSIKGSASGYNLTFTWKAKSGTGYGTPDKVTLSYYYNITDSNRQLQTKEFTGSQASSGSYSFSDCRYLMDSYNKVQVQFTISNSNGQNSYTVTYYNGSFYGTF